MQKKLVNLILYVPVLLIPIILSSCSSTEPIKISTKIIEKPILNIPNPRPVNLTNPNWIVITENNKDTILQQNTVIFGMTIEDYRNISINQTEILRVLEFYKNMLQAYKNYYEPQDKKSEQ